MLRLRGLTLGYGRGPDIVRDVDLDVAAGEAIAIIGPSGGGKSTLLKALAGLIRPRRGEVTVLGTTYPRHPAAGAVGYVPQRLGLVRHSSVMDNVVHGGLAETPFLYSAFHRVPAPIHERALTAISALRLAGKEDEPIHRLSGGQQRRVAVARALVQRPKLLLADEFLSELDPDTANIVLAAVKDLQRTHGTTVVLVEHQMEQAMRAADHVYRLKAGGIDRLEDA